MKFGGWGLVARGNNHVTTGLELAAPTLTRGRGEWLGIELNHQWGWFNQSYLHSGTATKTLNNEVQSASNGHARIRVHPQRTWKLCVLSPYLDLQTSLSGYSSVSLVIFFMTNWQILSKCLPEFCELFKQNIRPEESQELAIDV